MKKMIVILLFICTAALFAQKDEPKGSIKRECC